jgi:ferrous iron transport protein A
VGSSEAADTCTLQSAIESAIREFDLRGIDFARGFLYNRNVTKAEVTKMNKPRDSHARAGERTGDVSLRDAKPGKPYTMTGTSLDDRHAFRLEEMGLRKGTMLTVIQRTNFGGRVVASGTQRIAIDGGTARSIFVTPAAGRDSQLAPQHDTADRQEA